MARQNREADLVQRVAEIAAAKARLAAHVARADDEVVVERRHPIRRGGTSARFSTCS